MPDIPACFHRPVCFVIGAGFYSVDDFFGCDDLVWSHDKERFVSSENAILGQDIEDRVLGKKCLGKIHQISDWFIGMVCPPARKLKTIA